MATTPKGYRAPLPKHETTPAPRPAPEQAAPTDAGEAPSARAPVAAFRCRNVSAAIFAEPVKIGDREVTLLNISVRRSYRDAQGQWHNTHTFRTADLPLVVLALQQAYEHIVTFDGNAEE